MGTELAMVSVSGRMLHNRAYRTPTLPAVKMEPITCPVCNRLFFYGTLPTGTAFEIKCGKCHNFTTMVYI